MTFDELFAKAYGDGRQPFPFQREFALRETLPALVRVPTGLGKTAMAILGWLYRRRFAGEAVRSQTPRRLVYCLPMRVLVEQTRDEAKAWLARLGRECDDVEIHCLMGGVDADSWEAMPERDAIVIGTQDMLLSRALNRGYGMSRYRWPMHFGLLNNDCHWIYDEVQLMGAGVPTSTQLEAFRRKLGSYGATASVWMSATLDEKWLDTVDFERSWLGAPMELSSNDLAIDAVAQRIHAVKPLTKCDAVIGDHSAIAADILQRHQPGSRTLAVFNTVDRATAVYQCLVKSSKADCLLIHSRFRPLDRAEQLKRLFEEPPKEGVIAVSTQVVEAGVDVSAQTLFTEAAPWASLVQRFGRCNRKGEFNVAKAAQVVWIPLSADEDEALKVAAPYALDEIRVAEEALSHCDNVGPGSLGEVHVDLPMSPQHVIRRRDLLDLFDTTPDLAGNDIDISRWIRDADELDVQVYWREWDRALNRNGEPPSPKDDNGQVQFAAPQRNELCRVAIGKIKKFLTELRKKHADQRGWRSGWRWNPLDREWQEVGDNQVRPGMVLLLHAQVGGYSATLGWTGDSKDKPTIDPPLIAVAEEAMDDENIETLPVELSQHLADVATAAEQLQIAMDGSAAEFPWKDVVTAARWHDVGKSHIAFQTAMRDHDGLRRLDSDATRCWAKSGGAGRLNYRIVGKNGDQEYVERRVGFRHELASALAWLHAHGDDANADLVAYLIAAHHGKVRLSIRSMPNERKPRDPAKKFARGIWDEDQLPAIALGDGEQSPPFVIDLSLMNLGETIDDETGRARRSWLARTLALRDASDLGPFRLAYLETLVRIADWRGTAQGEHHAS